MITGRVRGRELVVPLPIVAATGQVHTFEFVIDTGFDGTLSLRPATIAGLGLPFLSGVNSTLADGTRVNFKAYAADIVWDGTPQPTLIQGIENSPLLGTALLQGHDIRIRFEDGGVIEIALIP